MFYHICKIINAHSIKTLLKSGTRATGVPSVSPYDPQVTITGQKLNHNGFAFSQAPRAGLCITRVRLYPWTHGPGREIKDRQPVFSFVCILPCFLRSNRPNFELKVIIRTCFRWEILRFSQLRFCSFRLTFIKRR